MQTDAKIKKAFRMIDTNGNFCTTLYLYRAVDPALGMGRVRKERFPIMGN